MTDGAVPQVGSAPARGLTKTDYMSGVQCHKLLWLRRHEPDAKELQPDRVLQDLFDQGNLVGALARDRFPGGVLLPYKASRAERAHLTAELIAAGCTVLFEAAFLVDCGSGVTQRLVGAGSSGRALDALFLTHLHSDHLVDLFQLVVSSWHQGRDRKQRVFGPKGTRGYVEGLMRLWDAELRQRIAHERRASTAALEVEVTEFDDGWRLEEKGVRVTAFEKQQFGTTQECLPGPPATTT